MDHLYVCGCIALTVYGQLILKWRIASYPSMPESATGKAWFLAGLLIDPFIMSGFAAAFIASLFWMAAMTKFEISYAYPFMSLAFVLVFLFSVVFLGEAFTLGKVLGVVFIVTGIVVTVRL